MAGQQQQAACYVFDTQWKQAVAATIVWANNGGKDIPLYCPLTFLNPNAPIQLLPGKHTTKHKCSVIDTRVWNEAVAATIVWANNGGKVIPLYCPLILLNPNAPLTLALETVPTQPVQQKQASQSVDLRNSGKLEAKSTQDPRTQEIPRNQPPSSNTTNQPKANVDPFLKFLSKPEYSFELGLFMAKQEVVNTDDNITYLSVNDDDDDDKPAIATVDVSPLDEGELLTDKVINDWMEYLITNEVKPKGNKIHIFNTFFFRTLIKEDYSYKYFNFYEARKFVDVDLWTFQKVIIPVFTPGHWTLALVDLVEGEISYLDSLGGKREEVLRVIRFFFCCDNVHNHKGKRAKEVLRWTLEYPSVPRQDNGVDCGVYLCMFATDITEGKKISELGDYSVTAFRKNMVYDLQRFYKQNIRSVNQPADQDHKKSKSVHK